MRKSWLLLALVVVGMVGMALPVKAQDEVPKSEVFLGYTYTRFRVSNTCCGASSGFTGFNFNGGLAQGAYNVTDYLGFVGEFGGQFTGANSSFGSPSVTLLTYLFGPRLSITHGSRFRPFVHVLLGGVHSSVNLATGSGGQNGFAVAPGGGVDFGLTKRFAIRGEADYLATRLKDCQLDPASCTTITNVQNNFRIVGGVVIRFGER
jgi:hypothetical protein